MKICVCSDSHGNAYGLQTMADREKPDLIWFLGDGERDWTEVTLPQSLPFAAVCGNCDLFSLEPPVREFPYLGHRILLTHGHRFGVKSGLEGLLALAGERGLDLICFGHTHQPLIHREKGCLFLNPGSMGYGSERYAILSLEAGVPPQARLCRLSDGD